MYVKLPFEGVFQANWCSWCNAKSYQVWIKQWSTRECSDPKLRLNFPKLPNFWCDWCKIYPADNNLFKIYIILPGPLTTTHMINCMDETVFDKSLHSLVFCILPNIFLPSCESGLWCWGHCLLISPLSIFIMLQNCVSNYSKHVHIWQVSPQLSWWDTCQIWTWYSIHNKCLKNFLKMGKIRE